MMSHRSMGLVCMCIALSVCVTSAAVETPDSPNGYRLATQKEFLVISSHKIRPLMTYDVHVTLFSMHYTDVTVRVMLSRNEEEYASTQVVFIGKGTKVMQLLIPENVQPGNHKMVVEGLVSGGRGDPIFHNETKLEFDSKYMSLFIQTDKPMYYPPQTVLFRIIGVTPDLKPIGGQDMTIYVKDSHGNIVRRWLNQELQFGMLSSSFELTYPTNIGTWYMMVDAYGHRYEQSFEVDFYYRRIVEVNITTPLYIFDTDWGLAGTFHAKHWSTLTAQGNATMTLRIRNQDGTFLDGEIKRHIAYVSDKMPFSYSMQEITSKWGDVADKDLFIKGYLHDFFFTETENGTSVTRVIKDGVTVQRLGRKFRTFKPEVPFTVYFAVSRSDGSPYIAHYNRQVLLEVIQEADGPTKQFNERVIIPSDSIIRYEITPRAMDRRIKIMASHLPTGSPAEIWLYRYHSQNRNYISVTTSTESPKTEHYMTFTVRTNIIVPELNYLIQSGGRILLGNTLTMASQQKTFAVTLSREMAPQARMVVYCVKDEEVLMDTLTFFVRDQRLYNSTLMLNLGKDLNYHTIELIGRGYTGGFLSVNGLDYEWYKRGADTFLDEERVVRELMTYNEPNEGAYKHIWYHNDARWQESVYFTAHSGGLDFSTALNVSGLVALSDMNFTVKQEFTGCNRSMGVGICLDYTCYDLKKTCDGWPDCEYDGFDEIACPLEEWEIPRDRPLDIHDLHKTYRYFEPTDWVWRTEYVKPNGQVELRLDSPEEPQPYVISGFILHPEFGLSLIKQPVQFDTTRRFFITSEYPESTRRGEQIGIRLGVFNYFDQDLETLITLHGGENYRFIHVEDFGVVSSYSPRLSAGDVQIMVELPAGEQRYIHFPVLPIIQQGECTVRITAYSNIDKDEEEMTIEVSIDGYANDDFIPFFMDLNNKGSQHAPYFSIPMPQEFVIPGERMLLYLPGSNVADVKVFGDVVGPGFFEDYLTADDMVGLPDDSAEGYMYDYAINLQTLNYLQDTRALDDSVAQPALRYMESILMRQYAYMQPDGSFKQFRRSDKPNVWLTSFVLRYLHKTLLTDWSEEVYIPVEILNKMALWLIDQQDEDGAFIETDDNIYDRSFRPESVDEDGETHLWHIPLTAHVVITFASTERLTGNANIESQIAMDKGADYLAAKVNDIMDPFQMAITAYALQMASHKDRDQAYIRLIQMAREDEHKYWASEPISPNPYEMLNAKYYMTPRTDFTNLGNAVMATSYALMLYLQHNDIEGALPIMRWLIAQHNDATVWSGTQDGLLALEALTAFALVESNREFFNLEIEIGATNRPDWGGRLTINRTNFYELQEFHLPNAWGEIKVTLTGSGYGFIGMVAGWNVDKDELLDNPPFETFDVNIIDKRFSGRNGSSMFLTPCVSWLREDITLKTGMVIVTVEVPTGYVVNRNEIVKLYWSGVPGLKRVRFRDGNLILFLEYLLPEGTCFTFEARRWYPVANVSITHGISLIEYAETGIKFYKMYDTYTLFHLHICQVCGSFQCPYCPGYNTATRLIYPTTTSLYVCLLVQLLITLLAMDILNDVSTS